MIDGKLCDAATAVFVFLSAATWTRFVAADFWTAAPYWQVKFHFTSTVTVHSGHCHRRLRLRNRPRRGRSSGRSVFFQQKLRKCRQEILECLQVRGAAEKIVQDYVLNVRHQLDEHVVSFRFVF